MTPHFTAANKTDDVRKAYIVQYAPGGRRCVPAATGWITRTGRAARRRTPPVLCRARRETRAGIDTLDETTMRARMAEAAVGRLATVTADDRPHIVPCCFALSGDAVYSAVDHKPKSTTQLRRLRNLRAKSRAALLVDHYDDDWSSLW